MVGLVICKNEEDPSKNEGTRVVTTFSHYKSMGIFPDAQGQLIRKSLMNELEWSQDFPDFNPMGAICCHGNQSSDPILPKT